MTITPFLFEMYDWQLRYVVKRRRTSLDGLRWFDRPRVFRGRRLVAPHPSAN